MEEVRIKLSATLRVLFDNSAMKQVSNNNSQALFPLSSTFDPGIRDQSSSLVVLSRTMSVHGHRLESYPLSSMVPLPVQSLQRAAEHLKPEVILDNNV
jgi:hypothetical protein